MRATSPNRKGFPGNASSPAPKIATLYSPLKLLVPTAAGFGLVSEQITALTYRRE